MILTHSDIKLVGKNNASRISEVQTRELEVLVHQRQKRGHGF
jgi:hypothetical protein